MIDIHIERKAFAACGRAASHTAIAGLRLHLEEHEFVCLVGPSGCGKTTLLNLIAGLDQDFEGHIRFHKTDTPRLGYVFQEPRLLPWRTVRENLALALPADVEPALLDELLEIAGLTAFQHTYPTRLSLGMSRRVALVRAFAVRPDLLLMDEPFVSLDAPTAARMRQLLQDLWQRRPHTVLFVTHDLREALELGDRIVFLSPPPTRVMREMTLPPRPRDRDTLEWLYRRIRGD